MMQKTPEKLRKDFWNADILSGGVVYNQYIDIKRILMEHDLTWVKNQYKEVKKHAIAQTDFYSSYSVEDEFPVMNKRSILQFYDRHKARAGYQEPIHISSTSGSTGTPFAIIQDFKKRKRNLADLKVFGELCDYPSHERMVFFRIFNAKLHRTPEQEDRENIYYIDSSDLGETHLKEMLDAVARLKPRIVFSYSSTLVELGKYAKKAEYPANAFSMKTLLTGGEGISEENRRMLERVFGCKVYRRYSDMELGILGQDMGDGGAYILNWGSYYFECLKIDSDEPADTGETGRIVITDLFNYAFPMIRYDTGDLGVMEYSSDGSLPYLKEIYGRVRDCVYTTDGRLLSPAKIFVLMWGAEGIKQWQFIQKNKSEYVLKLNCEENTEYSGLIGKLKSALGEDAIIQVEQVDEIPVVSSNKRRAVICNYQKRSGL